MNMNPMALMKIRERLMIFQSEHPKMLPFFNVIKTNALMEGSVFEIKAISPDGKEYVSNIKLTANDIETLKMLSENPMQ